MKVKVRVFLVMVCLVLIASCSSMKNLTPVEQASVIGSESATTYIALYNTYNTLEGMLEGDQLETLRKTASALNKAKMYLIAYNDLVIKWRIYGGNEPADLLKNKDLLNSLLAEISTILIGLM